MQINLQRKKQLTRYYEKTYCFARAITAASIDAVTGREVAGLATDGLRTRLSGRSLPAWLLPDAAMFG